MMLRRPHPGESNEDLLQEEEELVSQGLLKPSVTLIKPDKRKSDDVNSTQSAETSDGSISRSRFSRQRATKKQKEGIIDNTMLKEAVRCDGAAVLGRVVEHLVPDDPTRYQWQPTPSPHGFPRPLKLDNLNESLSTTSGPRKSLYMQQLEKRQSVGGKMALNDSTTSTAISTQTISTPSATSDVRLSALGSNSYILKDLDSSEADKIHKENMTKLASMSHEERLREQQDLLASLPKEQIEFFRSLRKTGRLRGKEILNQEKSKMSVTSGARDARSQGNHSVSKVENIPLSEDCEMEYEDIETVTGQDTVKSSESKVKSSSLWVRKKEKREARETDNPAQENMACNKGSESEVTESELPIPPSEAKQWLNMGKVEYEKLRWMTEMPVPRPLKNNEGFVARFNFEGDILPYDSDVSYRKALHHHGNEPGRAGYTIDELFTQIRSQVLQQRHIGLRTLGNILHNAKEGLYDTCVNPPVIQLVVEAGGVLLLRFALDDPSHLVYSEAVRTLLHLTSSDPDSRCLELARPWTPAGLEPGVASWVHASDKARQELDKEEGELKDHEIVKLDVIRALIRTDTHLRLRYLLETHKPGPETVTNILGLLTRIAQHSLAAAWSLAHTPRLLHVIINNFLPHNFSPLLSGTPITSMTTVYGVPLRHALQFLRVLAAKGRELAALLVNTHGLMSRILVYVSLEPSEISLPLKEALLLSQDAYSVWAVLLAYGLSKPVESVVSFYPLFVKQMVFYRDRVDVNEEMEQNKFNYDVGAQMINTLTRAVNVAASHSFLHARMKLNQGTLLGPSGKQVLQPPDLTWNDLRDLPHLVETCLAKWLVQLSRVTQASFSALRLIGSCCDFLSAYYTKWKDQTSYNAEIVLKIIETLYNNVISPAIVTSSFQSLLTSLIHHSCLISTHKPGTERDPINLGSLGCVSFGGEVVPIIQPSSPFPLLLPLSTLLLSLHSLHPALNPSSTTQLLNSHEVSEYLVKVCSSQRNLSKNWLTRIETHFISNFLQLAAMTDVNKKELYHQTAMCVITCVHKGDEHLVKELLNLVICNPKFVPDLTGVSGSIEHMSVQDYEPLKSPALAQPVLTPAQLTATIIGTLPAIGSELSRNLITKREYEASAVLKNGIPFVVNGITVSQTEFPLCLDAYWPLSPIKHAYNSWHTPQKQKQDTQENKSDQSSPEDILTVTRCLQMAYLGLKHRRSTVLHTNSHMLWLQYLSLTFLAANDLFLDPTVSSYLQGCIAELLKHDGYVKLDPTISTDCFNSCSDWYKKLAEHYMSVSYGDSTYALYLLVPLQQYLPTEFRTVLWGELCDTLQFVYLKPEQVKRFLPLQQFQHPVETEEGLIYKYRASLGSGMISAVKNSFIHSLALHHTQHYLANQATS